MLAQSARLYCRLWGCRNDWLSDLERAGAVWRMALVAEGIVSAMTDTFVSLGDLSSEIFAKLQRAAEPSTIVIHRNGRIYRVSKNGGVHVWALRLGEGYWLKCTGGPLSRDLLKMAKDQSK